VRRGLSVSGVFLRVRSRIDSLPRELVPDRNGESALREGRGARDPLDDNDSLRATSNRTERVRDESRREEVSEGA
jgi:hypothetical protein